MRPGQCDICSKTIEWGEPCIAFRIKDEERLVWCVPCAQKNNDQKVYKDKNWEPHIYGKTLWWD
jgi:hypothetical protein